MSDTARETRDLNARILMHEVMLALLVAMQALDLFWAAGDSVSAVLVYGFGIVAVVIWLRFLGVTFGPAVKRQFNSLVK